MFLTFGGLFFLLFGRLLFIQATGQAEGKVMAALAEAKYARESVLKADRGTIVDRNGELDCCRYAQLSAYCRVG